MTNTLAELQPQVLLLASRYDLTCDYVVSQLRRRAVRYLRVNSEDLCETAVYLDPVRRCLRIDYGGRIYTITPDCLHSVFFRRPVFLREYGGNKKHLGERFSQWQWAAFMRNLMLFHEARWVNDPGATYRAEHKALQLAVANELGFAVPETRVTNSPFPDLLCDGSRHVAIKGLDTVLLREDDYEIFGFTAIERADLLVPSAWRSAPVIIQTALTDKLDIRVTVVEEEVFAVSITADGQPIVGDWRTQKQGAQFSEHHLPKETEQRCRDLIRHLGLRVGCVDLALQGGEYFFLEINPTGEWAWLVDATGLPIDKAIGVALTREAR